MSVFLIKAAQLLLSLSILVVLHELGHFIPAKLFKTRVEKFYLFFDVKFSLFKKKIGDTVYGIGWLPLGGYVKISGMIDESMDTEQMALPPQPWEFRSKPAWQRLIIMLGGVTVNFILAFFLFIMMLFVWGTNYITKEDIKYGYGIAKTLETYGFQQGDKIISVNGKPFEELTIDINKYIMFRDVENIKVEHPDGTVADIQLPEDIGQKLFEAGDIPAMAPRYPFQLDSIVANSPADKAGLKTTDKIIAVNGQPIEYYSDLTYQIKNNTDKTLNVEVERNNEIKNLNITQGEDKTIGVVSTVTDPDYIKIQNRTYSFSESITGGISKGYWEVKDYLAQFQYIFTKKGASQIGGFAAIGNMFPAQWDWQAFWYLTAFLSIMLAVLNLLPIPALDGGHVMFLLYEMVSGRKPGDKFMEYAQMVGFFILIALVLFANGNDIFKAIFN
ncbi:Putative zinc metalloprotease [Mariniflexile rhizosphaerae]|uniref:RIP metalloprotease RseP n=1 Tax=unclassified Mariniflexile TaxID=2643887 RepID=UPI000CC28257|nr:RIP metalloprotease RseP [Mariniflexile sp. TRM1-10]AXP80425.1 Putative zinc metalloprotease [Mariniflexile sp. TRM1-10]PLB20555.1 MAG: Zinc metalloprotease [Flavobacteriaceae bacterium FS1-H7996/R]